MLSVETQHKEIKLSETNVKLEHISNLILSVYIALECVTFASVIWQTMEYEDGRRSSFSIHFTAEDCEQVQKNEINQQNQTNRNSMVADKAMNGRVEMKMTIDINCISIWEKLWNF